MTEAASLAVEVSRAATTVWSCTYCQQVLAGVAGTAAHCMLVGAMATRKPMWHYPSGLNVA